MKNKFLYLASESSRRKEILQQIGVPFKVVSSAYKERKVRTKKLSPESLTIQHATGKAQKAKLPKSARFVLGADTIVCRHKKILGKPKTKQEAVRMLKTLSGDWHEVYTGLVLLDRETGETTAGCCMTSVLMKRLSDKELKTYVTSINPLDKAGSYAIQEGPKIVEKINGSYTNVIGLPTELLQSIICRILFTK